MALDTSKVLLPKEVATVITKRAKDTSTIAALSPSEPQLFLDKDYMVFTGNSEAEVVAEGAQKSSYEETLTPVVGKRFKVQTTTRLSNELQWADDDAKLEIISKIQADQAAAMGRVLDYVVYHAFDPKKKTTLEGFNALAKSAVSVTATDDRVADIDSLAEVVSDEYDINGIALSKTMANELRKIRVPSTGQRFYPEIPINLQVGNLDGIPAATSGTVNGRLITPATGILAFLGDFRLIKWGMVRDIWSEIIEYGDPDNTGKDLKGVNQIAYRTEAMYSYAILDPKGHRRAQEADEHRQGGQVMAAPLTQTLVVQETDEADEAGLSIPVRLVKPDGTPFAEGVATIAWSAITGKPSTFTPPAPTAGARGGVLQQAAEAQLAASADSAAIIAKVNSMLTKLKAAGILA